MCLLQNGRSSIKRTKVEHSNQVNFVIVDVSNRYLEDVTETLRYFQISSTPTYIILDKTVKKHIDLLGMQLKAKNYQKFCTKTIDMYFDLIKKKQTKINSHGWSY